MHSSPITVTRTRRIQDWASYFYACRFPPEKELDTKFSTKNMNPNPMNGDRDKESDGKLLQEIDDTNWPHLEAKDYIVFNFTNKKDIPVVEDRKRGMSRGSDIEIYLENEQDIIISFEKGEENWRYGIRETTCTSSPPHSESSSDYNQSNASKRSFAFPVLGLEWVGSPVHIPKHEDSILELEWVGSPNTCLKKHRSWFHGFLHCYRS